MLIYRWAITYIALNSQALYTWLPIMQASYRTLLFILCSDAPSVFERNCVSLISFSLRHALHNRERSLPPSMPCMCTCLTKTFSYADRANDHAGVWTSFGFTNPVSLSLTPNLLFSITRRNMSLNSIALIFESFSIFCFTEAFSSSANRNWHLHHTLWKKL